MSAKSFFRKAGSDIKQFFKPKSGTLAKTFSKGGSAEKFINKVGAGIDTAVKVAGDVAGKVGRVAGSLAPVLMAVNPELGLAASAIGAGASQVGSVAKKVGSAKRDAVDAFNNKKSSMIQAIKPAEPVMDEPMVNFA
jgi:hypothetical protein